MKKNERVVGRPWTLGLEPLSLLSLSALSSRPSDCTPGPAHEFLQDALPGPL